MDFSGIIGLLDEQTAVQTRLVALSQEKRKVIIEGDTERLNAISGEEARLVHSMGVLEKKRSLAAAQLAPQLGVKPQDVTVSLLVTRAQGADKLKLQELQKQLSTMIATQKSLNEMNKKLLETHLEHIDMMLNMIIGPEDPLNNLYGGDGAQDNERRSTPGIFDKQV